MNRHNLPLARHAATDMSAIGWVMIAYSSNCLISQGWLASIVEGDSIINVTLLYFTLLRNSTLTLSCCMKAIDMTADAWTNSKTQTCKNLY